MGVGLKESQWRVNCATRRTRHSLPNGSIQKWWRQSTCCSSHTAMAAARLRKMLPAEPAVKLRHSHAL